LDSDFESSVELENPLSFLSITELEQGIEVNFEQNHLLDDRANRIPFRLMT
jgi:hypothetical protein